ncbi:MAG: transporter [Planctomycetia bacterium]|nr:transporter [Planctomycetia bacterium]
MLRYVFTGVGLLLFVLPTFAQDLFPVRPNTNEASAAPTMMMQQEIDRGSRIDSLWTIRRPRRDALGQEQGTQGSFERPDEIETDRDSFTPAVTTVARHRTILESAYTFTDFRHGGEGHSFPELLVRYGLTDRWELRLGWNYEIAGIPALDGEGAALPDEGGKEFGNRVTYGSKFRLTEAEGWMPGSAIILAGATPTGGPATDTHFIATYVFGWEFANRWKLDASFRYGTGSEEEDRFNEWAPSLVLKVPIGEKINTHVEYFSIFSTGKEEAIRAHYFSPGVHFLVTENFEIGVRVAWGLNEQATNFFANAGIGWRF